MVMLLVQVKQRIWFIGILFIIIRWMLRFQIAFYKSEVVNKDTTDVILNLWPS